MSMDRLKELHKKALKIVEEMNEEEKKLLRELVSTSPNKYMYLGYVPIHLRGSVEA